MLYGRKKKLKNIYLITTYNGKIMKKNIYIYISESLCYILKINISLN